MKNIAILLNFFLDQYIIMGSEDNLVYVWRIKNGTILQRLEGHNAPVISACVNPVSKKIATCSLDGHVRIWTTQMQKK